MTAAPSPEDRPTAPHDDGSPELTTYDRDLRGLLAPFVAWLATQDLDEAARRRHRDATDRYLRWSHVDDGTAHDRHRRYAQHLRDHDPGHVDDARTGLGWWGDYRRILACTLPVEPGPGL